MSLDLFKSVVDQAAALTIPKLRFHWRGEPMLHPQWGTMIEYAKNAGIGSIVLITNGTVLTPENRKTLFNSGLDELQVSLDALSKSVFEIIRLGARHDQVVNHLHALLRERATERHALRVVLRFTALRENEQELEGFCEYWKDRVDDIIVTADTRPGAPALGFSLPRVPNRMCHDLSRELFVSWDGLIFPCFVSWNGELKLGDTNTETLADIWLGTRLAELRSLHSTGRRNEIPLCAGCTADQCLIRTLHRGEIRRVGVSMADGE